LSDSTVRTESRLKSLFWPSIQNGADVDYLGVQGFWVCTLVGVLYLGVLVVAGQPVIGVLVFLLFHFGGVGVREHNPFAAAMVLIYYVIDTWASGIGIFRIIVTALLLSNVRASWIADHWEPESDQAALPPRMGVILSDQLATNGQPSFGRRGRFCTTSSHSVFWCSWLPALSCWLCAAALDR